MQRKVLTAVFSIALSLAAPAALRAETFDRALESLGESVERFWAEFSSVSCLETLQQEKIDPKKGKVVNRKTTSYDYLVLMQWVGSDPVIEESRVIKSETKTKKKKRPSHRSLLVTNGFSIMLLVFHPVYQGSYVFTRLQDELVDGRFLGRIGFEHVRGARSPSILRLKDVDYPLEWKGTAWIDHDSGAVVRIEAGLKTPIAEIGLDRLDTEVWYRPTRFHGGAEVAWMPSRAVIEAASKRQLWKNTHLFSDYKQFAVDTEVQIADPE